MRDGVVEWRGLVFVEGGGLDEILEAGFERIVLLDEYYSEVYGDYIFLGYDVVAEDPETHRADAIGFYYAGALLEREPAVVVCGSSLQRCLAALAARLILEGRGSREAVEEASRVLRGLGEASLPPAALAGLSGLEAAVRLVGSEGLAAIVSVAASYNYGRGRLHYGEAVSWTRIVGGRSDALAAALIHFLVEGPGPAWEVLEKRLEALGGPAALRELLGELAGPALEALREYAEGKPRSPAARLLALVESLGPGDAAVAHIERVGESLVVYCGGMEPTKPCLERVGAAYKFLPVDGLERIRVAVPSSVAGPDSQA